MPGFEAASRRLALEFEGAFTDVAIEQELSASYDSLASTSTVHNFLSILAERSARQRLRVLAAGQESALPGARAG
jgi:arsenate reductase (thioredoxin)